MIISEVLTNGASIWAGAIAVISSVYGGLTTIVKFREKYWIRRNLQLYKDLAENSPPKSKERMVLRRAEEEEKFYILFKRPSTPKLREATYSAIADGIVSVYQFRLCKLHFDVNELNQLYVDLDWKGKLQVVFQLILAIILGLSASSCFVILLGVGTLKSLTAGVMLLLISVFSILYFMRDAISIIVAFKIKSKLCQISH